MNTPRRLLALLLLLNYLLVVGAGLRVGRPAPPYSAARPYVHSAHCQHDNYLRLDCFEGCNGDQALVLKQLPGETNWHFLAQLKGLDVHFGAVVRPLPTQPVSRGPRQPARARGLVPAALAGYEATTERPPSRG